MITPQRLYDLLRASAERDPTHIAFIRRRVHTSYGELYQAADRLAAGLQEMGVRAGDRVALVLDNVLEYPVSIFGILKAGAVVVPLCPDTRRATLRYALEHCEATAVILDEANSALLQGASREIPSLRLVLTVGPPGIEDEGGFKAMELAQLLRSPSDARGNGASSSTDDLAAIIYTSGTTARPKGVMLSHRNLLANTRSIVEYLQLTAADSVAMVLPFFYSYGNSILHTHIAVGGTIAVVGTMAFPAAVLASTAEHRCTGFSGVPSTFARLVQSRLLPKHDLSCLRYITQAGGPMTPALTRQLKELLPQLRIFVMYGQTEASARLSYLPPEDLERKLGSVGKGIPGVTLMVMDESGTERPRGEVGEIVATGENIMGGYWRSPEETRRVLRPEGLRTGDLGRMDEDGYLWIVGRDSDMIKSGAHRISPKEIEEVIENHPQVSQCAVVGVPDDILGEAIAAFIVPLEGAQVAPREILALCHDHLPRFKLPAHVRIVSQLPRTMTGKLMRQELRKAFSGSSGPEQ